MNRFIAVNISMIAIAALWVAMAVTLSSGQVSTSEVIDPKAEPVPVDSTSKIDLPVELTDSGDKLVYALKVQEELRRMHNLVGDWTRQPLDSKVYDALPVDIKAALPTYKADITITQEEFETFRSVYDSYDRPVIDEIQRWKEAVRAMADTGIDLGAVKK